MRHDILSKGLPAALAVLAISCTAITQAAPLPAMTNISIEDPQGRRDLDGWIWYPTHHDAAQSSTFGNAVWASVEGVKDGAPAEGKRPLVLVSHGMYGNIFNQAWLARALAVRGYLVAAVNHPGSTTFDRRREESRKLWERPADMSRLLDSLLDDPVWAARIDRSRVAAVGHSLGGLTVMRIAGATGDNKAHIEFCASEHRGSVSCTALTKLNIGHPEDTARLAASNRDERISAVVSLDLGGTQTLSADSVAAIEIPVLVMGAPRGKQINQQIESRALAAMLPADKVVRLDVPGTGHFDFLGLCTDRALAILKEEEPDDVMVCIEGQQSRAARHAQFVDAIDAFLAERMPMSAK